jgi:ribonuclease P protein subunit RPR2
MKLSVAKKKIALQRVHKLFQLAKDLLDEDEELSQRYIAIARRIAMAARVHLPQEYRYQICRGCKKFILPGVNCRVRLKQHREPHMVITCGYCGKHMRFPLRIRKTNKNDYNKSEA